MEIIYTFDNNISLQTENFFMPVLDLNVKLNALVYIHLLIKYYNQT